MTNLKLQQRLFCEKRFLRKISPYSNKNPSTSGVNLSQLLKNNKIYKMCYFHVGLFVARVINQGPIMQIVTAQCTPSNAQSFPISHAPRVACVVLMSRTLIKRATFSMSTAQFCYTLRIYNETDFPNWNQGAHYRNFHVRFN